MSFFLNILKAFSAKVIVTEPLTIAIDLAPAVLNLQTQGEVVTVHTDIPNFLVVADQVTLNGTEIDSLKADNRCNFIANS